MSGTFGKFYWLYTDFHCPIALVSPPFQGSAFVFRNNSGLFGNDVASSPFLVALEEDEVHELPQSPNLPFVGRLSAVLTDYYGQVGSSSHAEINLQWSSVGVDALPLLGEVFRTVANGRANFTGLLSPNVAPGVTFSVALRPTFSALLTLSALTTVSVRNCIGGEEEQEKSCILCPRGFYSVGGAGSKCVQCLSGLYQDEIGQGQCKKAPQGGFARLNGSVIYENCPRGFAQNQSGQASCSPCQPNFEAPDTGMFLCSKVGLCNFCLFLLAAADSERFAVSRRHILQRSVGL